MDAHNIPAMIIRYACTTSVIYYRLLFHYQEIVLIRLFLTVVMEQI